MRKPLQLLSIVALFCLPAVSNTQTIGQNKSADDGTYRLSVKSRLVVEAVSVVDKQGKPIQNLTAADFTLTEDGVVQRIRSCEHQTLSTAATPLPQSAKDEEITVYKHLSRTAIAGENGDDLKYRDRRLIALYFDMTAMGPAEQQRSLDAAEKFIRTSMTEADRVALLRYNGGSVDVLEDFSADRNRLLSILETMIVGEGQGERDSIQDDSSSDTGAAFGQNDAEFNIFNTDRQLSALQTAANMLGHLNEKKVLVYFAGGLRLNGVDNQAQLHATVNAAVRAGVSFWPVDARGLVADPPLGDATRGSPGGQAMYTGASALAQQSNLQRSQDTLFSLAGDTGGKALLDNNDLGKGIRNAQASLSDYYLLAYYTTNTAEDGRFRRIKITARDAEAKLDYRQGYYASKQFAKFTEADKERQLEDALMLDDPITELTVALELNYFQLNRAEYFVPLTVKIPGRELALAKKGGAERTTLDFIGEIKDVNGNFTVTNVRDHISSSLSNTMSEELVRKPLVYDAGFTLLPGSYRIKFLVRDDETGRIGTFQTNFEIPNLNNEEKRLPISSVVLGSQRVPLGDSLYNTQKKKDLDAANAANPLIDADGKLIPSVTRVFQKDRRLYVYLQGYEQGATAGEPLAAYVTLFGSVGVRVLDTQPAIARPVTAVQSSSVAILPMSFSVDLSPLPADTYTCQVTVVAPRSGKTQFWRGNVAIR